MLKPLLLVISLVYRAFVFLRLQAYTKGWLKTYYPNTPVISVGNLTVGGTGKTPVVDLLSRELQGRKIKPAILSRGYGRKNNNTQKRLRFCENKHADPDLFGDEPYMLAMRNPEVPVYVDSSRIAAADSAEKNDNPDVLVLDDAFQHLAIHRDLNLLLIDAERGLGNGNLIPYGILREPASQWKRADAIIVTKANISSTDAVSEILNKELKVTCPVFNFNFEARDFYRLDGEDRQQIQHLAGKNLLTVSGIAQPDGFRKMLESLEGNLTGSLEFADHHDYSINDVHKILKKQDELKPDFIVTTEKDAVKLRQFSELSNSVWILEIGVHPEESWNAFFEKFLDTL
ncbi:MAG: tetraacyldisaccharide 4'-kinase [SAR324 cluster bacterium]|nr:tetraacyldisaccharide 4'-kinase [SAR324 cluster bacterium]